MRTMRTIALIVLGCILASIAVLIGLIVWLGAVAGIVAALAIAGVVIGTYVWVIGPWQRRWGATDREVARPMPGDERLRPDAPSTTRAITIEATPEAVFPWLLQIGYGRGGWYSYDWIDNDGKPSVEHIDPVLQRLTVGDRIEMVPGFGPIVVEIEPDHHIVAAGETDSWCLQVEATPDGKEPADQPLAAGLAALARRDRLGRLGGSRCLHHGAADAPAYPRPGRQTLGDGTVRALGAATVKRGRATTALVVGSLIAILHGVLRRRGRRPCGRGDAERHHARRGRHGHGHR